MCVDLDSFIHSKEGHVFAICMHMLVFLDTCVCAGVHLCVSVGVCTLLLMQLHQDCRLEKWFPPQYNGESVSQCCFRKGGLIPWSLLCCFTPVLFHVASPGTTSSLINGRLRLDAPEQVMWLNYYCQAFSWDIWWSVLWHFWGVSFTVIHHCTVIME